MNGPEQQLRAEPRLGWGKWRCLRRADPHDCAGPQAELPVRAASAQASPVTCSILEVIRNTAASKPIWRTTIRNSRGTKGSFETKAPGQPYVYGVKSRRVRKSENTSVYPCAPSLGIIKG